MKKFLLLSIALFFFSSSIIAQNTRQISLQEAINIALDNNYALKQARNNLDLAEKSIMSEYADFLPNISSSLSGSRRTGQQFIEVRSQFVDVESQAISGGLDMRLTLFDGFNNINTLRASKNSKISREESYQRAKETVIFNTASNFLQVLLSQELLEIAKQNLEYSNTQLEQVQAQVDVGSRPIVDLYNQESTVAQNELLVTQRENTLQLNKILLIRQLEIDPMGNYDFIRPNIDENIELDDMASFNLNELIDQALLNRSDLKSSVANINNLDYQTKIAMGNLYPSLTLSYGLDSRYSDQYRVGNEKVGFSDQFFDQQINKSYGISFSLPLFQNWNRMYNIQSSQVQLKNAKLDLDNTRLQVIQEVTQAYNDYTSYLKELESSRKALVASEKAFETEQERYNVGANTLIELSQAQASFVEARSNYSRSIFNLIFQEKLLDYYLGKLNSEEVEF